MEEPQRDKKQVAWPKRLSGSVGRYNVNRLENISPSLARLAREYFRPRKRNLAFRTMTYRWIFFWVAAVLATAFFSHRVHAEITCFGAEEAEQILSKKNNEILIGFGVTITGDLVKIFANLASKKWTIAVYPMSHRGKVLCPVMWGNRFERVENVGTDQTNN